MKEPLKSELVPYLIESEHEKRIRPHREARVQIIVQHEIKNQLFELGVDLDEEKVTNKQYLEGKHSFIDPAYMQAAEKACLADPRIQDEIKTLELPQGAKVVVESWAYATDGMNDMSERTTMVSPADTLSPGYANLLGCSVGSTFVCWITRMRTTMLTLSTFAQRFQRILRLPKYIASPPPQMSKFTVNPAGLIVAKYIQQSQVNIILIYDQAPAVLPNRTK